MVSSFSRALLAFTQSSIASAGGETLSDLEVAAMGEILVGIPLGMLLPSLCSPEMKYLPAEVVHLAGEREA